MSSGFSPERGAFDEAVWQARKPQHIVAIKLPILTGVQKGIISPQLQLLSGHVDENNGRVSGPGAG